MVKPKSHVSYVPDFSRGFSGDAESIYYLVDRGSVNWSQSPSVWGPQKERIHILHSAIPRADSEESGCLCFTDCELWNGTSLHVRKQTSQFGGFYYAAQAGLELKVLLWLILCHHAQVLNTKPHTLQGSCLLPYPAILRILPSSEWWKVSFVFRLGIRFLP